MIGTNQNSGWLFAFGLYRIHYFINGVSLCGKAKSGQQSLRSFKISKPIQLDKKDSRACKRCVFMLETYNDLKNKLN